MPAKGLLSRPETVDSVKEVIYPERELHDGRPYEFTTEVTETPPAELFRKFHELTREMPFLGLFYAADFKAKEDLLLMERTEGRQSICEKVENFDQSFEMIETAWLPGGKHPVRMRCMFDGRKKNGLIAISTRSPTAGGQYHWVSEFSPRKWQKILSYTTGWLTAIAWQVYLAIVCFMVGTIIQGLIVLNNPEYVWHYWHGTLLTIAISVFGIFFNTVLATKLPLLQAFLLVLHIGGLLAIILPLWIMAPWTPAKQAFFEFTNNGGWPTTGLSAMIGLVAPMSSLSSYDCAVHMAEEIQDASITLPRAIMWSTVLNASIALVMSVTLILTFGDIDSLLASPTRQPFIQLFYNATLSYPGTNAMVGLIAILIAACCIDETATASRQAWEFARDNGFPCSSWLSKVTPGWDVPLDVSAILGSYFITISCIVYRRIKGPPLPARRWSLGRFGLAINITALAFLTPVWFFLLWPLAASVTATNMNWAPVMFVGVLAIAMVYYAVRGKRFYSGPVALVKRDQ